MTGATTLDALARGYRKRRAAAALLLSLAVVAAAASTRFRFAPGPAGTVMLGVAVVIALFAIGYAVVRNKVDARQVARHVDRADASLGESAELLLVADHELPLAERLARRQAEGALARSTWRVAALPDRGAARMSMAALALLAAAGVVAFAPRVSGDASDSTGVGTAPGRATRVARLRIEIEPPGYLRVPRRTQGGWDLDVPEGAVVRWSVRTSRPVDRPAIVTSRGDTIPLAASDDGDLRGTLRARESTIYRFEHADGVSDFHRIAVRPDAEPTVTVLRPAPRTVLPTGASRIVPLEVLVRDDHGITTAGIVATVTSGSGESVRFRERRLALLARRRTPEGARFSATVNLDSLGMAPGDELYFYASARDNRQPPGEGRSETVFLALADTAQRAAAEFTGLAVGAGPEYFRSQRQIIIDTERLIADAARLPIDVFRERANAIGMDQGLLRLRYGEFTGEEFEASATPDAAHEHDDPENATLLDPGTKATLKGAIAEMWQAELRLRTYRPREALPYEYRALELLKTVQQASRAYVQRVGFEPPPLEPDEKRLSGKLDAIRGASRRVTAAPDTPFEAAVRAITRLRELRGGRTASGDARATIAAAIAEVAARAPSGDPAQLVALRALQALADSLGAGRPCAPCAARAERALLAVLPAPPEAPALPSGQDDLRKRYVQLLHRP